VPSSFGRFAILALVAELLFARVPDARADPAGSVVFVAPAVGELDDALRDALSAQLAGAEATLLFERFSADASTLRRQVTEARRLAAAHHAVGVFWLDASADKDWLLYLAEPGGDRILVRRITVESNGSAAATEAVAVITSESSQALAHGETIGMQPVVLPAEPHPAKSAGVTPPPVASPTRPGPRAEPPQRVRLFAGLAYYGDGPAQEIRWQSGARLSLGLRFPNGLYLNGGYLFFKEATVRGRELSFQVSRSPVDLGLGLALGRNRWRPALELRVVGDILARQVVSTGTTFQATPDATRVMIFVSPRARLDYAISAVLGAYLAGGLDAALNSFSFVSRVDGQDRPLLRPAAVRPAFEVGASFTP
jgi:hypothetical protein